MCPQRPACFVYGPVGSRVQVDLAAFVREGKREGHGTGIAVLAHVFSTHSHLLLIAEMDPVPLHPG